jgi:anti-anti-sigma factor
VVYASGEIDIAASPHLRDALVGLLERGYDTVLDLREVHFLDASGVGVLVAASRCAGRLGLQLRLRNPSSWVTRILRLTSHESLLVG